MISVVISIMIFSAMATLLSRCFSLWVEAQAHWKLAQHARITRTRLLYGGFGIGTGLLNATNVTVQPYGSWRMVNFSPVTVGAEHHIYGWPGSTPAQIWLQNDDGDYAWAQTVSQLGISDQPAVRANDFTANVTNSTVMLTYTLNFSAMGKNFELPQVIEAELVNE